MNQPFHHRSNQILCLIMWSTPCPASKWWRTESRWCFCLRQTTWRLGCVRFLVHLGPCVLWCYLFSVELSRRATIRVDIIRHQSVGRHSIQWISRSNAVWLNLTLFHLGFQTFVGHADNTSLTAADGAEKSQSQHFRKHRGYTTNSYLIISRTKLQTP